MVEGKKGQKNTALVVENGEKGNSFLTKQEFHELAAVPAEVEWFANMGIFAQPRKKVNFPENDVRWIFLALHKPLNIR